MVLNVFLLQDKDEALIVLSLNWTKSDELQTRKRLETCLQKMLQSWFNKRKRKVDCSLKRTLRDERVVIIVKPAPGKENKMYFQLCILVIENIGYTGLNKTKQKN